MKWLSRKFIITVATGVLNVLVMTGQIPSVASDKVILFLDALIGVYLLGQSVVDSLKQD